MSKEQIRQIVAGRVHDDGLTETGIENVRLFRATRAMPCVPAVYEPCVVAIVNGTKEAVFDGRRYVYDSSQYLCCPMSMPVKAGTPNASHRNPLYGVLVSIKPRAMAELAIEMEDAGGVLTAGKARLKDHGIVLSKWDEEFTDALFRLLKLGQSETDTVVLGKSRLRELYYAILKGDAGPVARQAFGAGNGVARSIAYVSSQLQEPISIDDMANRAGMSRASFHRKFKQATAMSPIQFVKSMRLNNAAMKIAEGMSVSEAALGVGYVSASQFSREFKRLYGQSPARWGGTQQLPIGVA